MNPFTFHDCISILFSISQKRSQKRIISPKTNFLLPQFIFGKISSHPKSLVFPSVFPILYFSQKHHTEKTLCHLTTPVSVFLTNSASLHTLSFQRRIDCRKRDSLTGFVTRFREGVWGRDFFKSIDFTRFLIDDTVRKFIKKDLKGFLLQGLFMFIFFVLFFIPAIIPTLTTFVKKRITKVVK